MTQGTRLRKAREQAGYSQQQLAEKIGMAQQALHKIEADITKNPRNMHVIESVLGLPPGYLKYGEQKSISTPQPIVARCPLLNWKEAKEWPKNKQKVSNETESLAQKIILGAESYALKITDNAMLSEKETTYRVGSYIIVDPTIEYKPSNFVIAIEDDSEEVIFRQYVKSGKQERLFAFNREFRATIVNEKVKILGVVVAHLDVLL